MTTEERINKDAADYANATVSPKTEWREQLHTYSMQAFKAGVISGREKLKAALRFRINFWNSSTEEVEPKYSYKDIFKLIDEL